MTKKLFLLITIAALSFQTASCTSNKSQDESDVVENADVEKIDAENSLTEEIDSTAAAGEDPAMQEALGESTASADAPPADNVAEEPALDLPTDVASAPTLDESSLNDVPAESATDTATADAPIADAPIVDDAPVIESSNSAPLIDNSGSSSLSSTDYSVPAPKPAESLLKLATTMPYQTPTGWVNTVYVARPGETIADISMKIFAADKVKDLKKIAENKYLKWRSAKAGDKIYYISPNRPDDSTKTILYYEDMGMVPETYVAKKGDNLKKVAKEILGYDKGYIELWTANPVESKDRLTAGETIRYWRSASGVTNSVANNSANQGAAQLVDPAQASQMPPQPQDVAMNQMPPPPDSTASLPPPPSMDQSMEQPMPAMDQPPADASASLPPPPPPPPADMTPPPPVDDMAATAKINPTDPTEEDTGSPLAGLDNETMTMAAVGILFAALAFTLIRRKKKKAAEMAAAMNETHVGS